MLAPGALKLIAKDLQGLIQKPPEDIQVVNSDQDLTEIKAWIRGPDDTPYENGYFQVQLLFGEGYPEAPPKGYFKTKIFHPNVAANGEICVNTLKKDWNASLGIKRVLLTIKCLLIFPNPESALNEEAGKLLLEQYDDYAKRARLFTHIHAKSGHSEYHALASQRPSPKQDEENPPAKAASSAAASTAADAKLGTKTTNTSATTRATSPTTTTNTTTTTTTTTTNVLTPSAVSNHGSTTVKRNQDKESDAAPTAKRQRAALADKKKHLRRL
ncbi:ubiquitin-conjugating enzyme/RWD-like protein [Syncephalastrum racemosum]|uniref:E2 ubiquitin-conjugating enzyme n=1 Tax=Syncephalastrum racemosum TaxID=13706 RepID=A0A1X2H2E2_SYNRA|nr:ubiquitin-conjugating enzyme/RWD-like protein [Syncephalastrum racemosum]